MKHVTYHMQLHKTNDALDKSKGKNEEERRGCRNVGCDRMQNKGFENCMGVCQVCFEPFWSVGEDKGWTRVKQRIVKKYHEQIFSGCQKAGCMNEVCYFIYDNRDEQYCKTYNDIDMDKNQAAVEAIRLYKLSSFVAKTGQYWFCVEKRILLSAVGVSLDSDED